MGGDKTGIHAILPGTRQGVVTGTVVGCKATKNELWFDVKPSKRGYTQRYWPRWVGGKGGFDQDMVRTIRELNVGDKVKVAWTYDERIRAAQLQVIARAKPAAAKKTAPADQTP